MAQVVEIEIDCQALVQASPELVLAKPKPICYCFRPIRIKNLRFNPIRAFVLFLINGSGDPYILALVPKTQSPQNPKRGLGMIQKSWGPKTQPTNNF